jgi:hypothetical protein
MNKRSWLIGSVALGALLGCAAEQEPAPLPEATIPATTKAANDPASSAGTTIRWRAADESVLLELKPKDRGFKLYGPDDVPLGKVKVSEDRVKLEDTSDTEIRKVKRKDRGIEIEDADGNRLYRIKQDEDGTFKLRNPAEETLAKLKPKDDGYEVRDATGATWAKVKAREGKLVFKSEEGETLSELKRVTDPRAGMWLAVETLTLPERASLVVYFLEVDN